ncbi:MAG: DUF2155 domain-containing protein [Hyphomicrobium sp.]
MRRISTFALAAASAGTALIAGPPGALAQRFENQVAVFAALDKVTARISKLEVPLNQPAEFGSLKLIPRVCYSRAPDEAPKTSTFVEVEETLLDGSTKKLFAGWMFAESPGLNAVEHPIFDVWLTGCAQPAVTRATGRPGAAAAQPGSAEPTEGARRRPPR